MKVVGHGAFGIVYSAIWRESKVAVSLFLILDLLVSIQSFVSLVLI